MRFKLIDLQVENHSAFFRLIEAWRPDVIAFSCNYLAKHPGNHRSLEGCQSPAAAHRHLRRRPQRLLCRQGDPSTMAKARSTAAARRRRGRRSAAPGGDRGRDRSRDCAGRGYGFRRGAATQLWSIRWMSCCRRAICCGTGANILSASSTLARRSNSRAAAPGTCSFCSAWTFYGRKLSPVEPGAGRRGSAADPRARHLYRRRRRLCA